MHILTLFIFFIWANYEVIFAYGLLRAFSIVYVQLLLNKRLEKYSVLQSFVFILLISYFAESLWCNPMCLFLLSSPHCGCPILKIIVKTDVKELLLPYPFVLLLLFPSTYSTASHHLCSSLVNFKLISECGLKSMSNFFPLHVDLQFSQQHWLKDFSFTLCVLYIEKMCVFMSVLSINFVHVSLFMSIPQSSL